MSALSQRFEGEEEEQSVPLLPVEQERMHARLEQYLVEAEAGLQSLSDAEQKAELMELRSHLGALMEAEQELGATPEEAAINTLKQFGSAREVTDKIVQVRQTPGQQLRRALVVCVLGAVLSHMAGQVLTWTQMREVESGGRIMTKFGLSTFLPVLTPLFLGTLVGRLFPRAHRARVPLVAAAFTWVLTSIWAMLGSPLKWDWSDYSFDLKAGEVWFKLLTNPVYLSGQVYMLLVFLTLAWAAQSVARRPARQGGLICWGKDLLSRIPDTWVGALGTYALVGMGVSLLRLPWTLWEMLQTGPRTTSPLSPASAAWSMASTIAIGALVGYLQPKRGWVAPLIQAGSVAIGMLYLIFSKSNLASDTLTYSLLFTAGALGATVVAFLIGRKRQTVR